MTNQNLGIGLKTTYDGRGVKQAADDLGKLGGAGKKAGEGGLNASQKFDLFKTTVGGMVATGILVKAGQQLVQLGAQSIATASDVEEMQSKFNTVFKDLAGPVTAELEAFAAAAGRSVYDLQGFAATLQDTFVPLGFARDAAADMSIELVQLAEDLASFNNLPTEQVVMDLQSALVGNTETLRKYGVVATQAAIDEKAMALGFEFTKGKMDAQTKAATILQIALESTSDAQGDAIRTADSYANVTKSSEAATKDLQLALGNILMPFANVGQAAKAQAAAGLAEYIEQAGLAEKATNQANLMMSTANYNTLAGELRDYGYGWRFVNDEVGKVESRFDLFRTEEEKMQEAMMAQQGTRRLAIALEVLENGFEGTDEQLAALVQQLDANYNRSALQAELRAAELAAAQKIAADEAARSTLNYDALAMVTDELTYKGDDYVQLLQQQEEQAKAVADAEDERRRIAEEMAATYDDRVNAVLERYIDLNKQAAETLQNEFIGALENGAPKVDSFNTSLLAQLDQLGASPETYGLAAIALGEYDKAQIEAAVNAAIIKGRIDELAQQFNDGYIDVNTLRLEMEALANGDYMAKVDVSTDSARSKLSALRGELEALMGGSTNRGSQSAPDIPMDTPNVNGPNGNRGGKFGGQKALGGPVFPGMSYDVGEAGPERFTPATAGFITPNSQTAQGGDQIIINNNSREAAALTMATIAERRRQKLDNYMGVG